MLIIHSFVIFGRFRIVMYDVYIKSNIHLYFLLVYFLKKLLAFQNCTILFKYGTWKLCMVDSYQFFNIKCKKEFSKNWPSVLKFLHHVKCLLICKCHRKRNVSICLDLFYKNFDDKELEHIVFWLTFLNAMDNMIALKAMGKW